MGKTLTNAILIIDGENFDQFVKFIKIYRRQKITLYSIHRD